MKEISSVAKSSAYVLMIAITYINGYSVNIYQEYNQITLNTPYIYILFLTVLFGTHLFHKKYKKPSDYFLLLYGMITIIPYAILQDIFLQKDTVLMVNLIVISLPFFSISCICRLNLKLPKISIMSKDVVMKIVMLSAICVVAFLLLNSPSTASFSLLDSYTRRLEARDLYESMTTIAYMSSIVMNSVLPLMVFIGVLQRRISYVLISAALYGCFYYIYGIKAPVLYMFFSGIFAYYSMQNNGLKSFFNTIYYIFVLIFFAAWVEFWLLDYSYIEDYIIRRIYYVGSYLISAYFSALNTANFSWMTGLMVEKSASMYIGEDYLGLPGANANTNTFLYFLLQYGVTGYLFSITLVGGVLLLLNSLRFRNDVFIFLSLVYAVLVLEQSATTALLSSGVGIMFLLFYFSRTNENRLAH